MRDQELLDLQEAYMEVCKYNENTDTEDLTEAGMRYFPSSSRPPERITGRFKSIRRNSTTNPDEDGPYRGGKKLDRPVNLTNQPANTETPQNTTPTRSARGRKSRIDLSKIQFNSYDYYDTVLSYLLDEGYAETPEAAEAIMVNMSEEWREEIIDEAADNVIMTVKSPSGQERSKIRKGATGPSDSHRHENPEQIANRRFSQKLDDKKREREQRMAAGRLTVATKRGIEAATNRSNDGVGGNKFVQGSSLRARERDDLPTDYRARRRRASGR